MFVQLKRQHTDGGTLRSGAYPYTENPEQECRWIRVAFLLSRSKARTLEGCARAKTCPSAAVPNIYKLDVTDRQKGRKKSIVDWTQSNHIEKKKQVSGQYDYVLPLKHYQQGQDKTNNGLHLLTKELSREPKELSRMVYRNPYDGYSEEGGGYSCQEEYAGCREPDSQYYTHQAQVSQSKMDWNCCLLIENGLSVKAIWRRVYFWAH